jgi:regulator of sigma E protease
VLDRNGERLTKEVTPGSETKYEMGTLGIGPVQRPQIIAVRSGKPAEKAGLRRGDVLLSVGGQTRLNRELTINAIRNNGPKPIEVIIERDGQPLTFTITPDGDAGSSIIGFDFMNAEFDRIDPSLSEAFRMSLRQNWDTSKQIGATLKGLITRETPVKQLMGPLAIADLSNSYAELGWRELLGFMALISLNLALLNLMPVPILDGGQIAILAIEGVTRRDMSLKIRERIAVVGAALILALMVTVIYNDIARLMR